ncbi:MAG TPA: Ig-like domain-containing protein [Candidatus Sulfotelmatobacter sp.]|nr:Ig-like domain-containing protein [Candidatus Sulfotelmatobacter sp.]
MNTLTADHGIAPISDWQFLPKPLAAFMNFNPSSEMVRSPGSTRWKGFIKVHAACAALLCFSVLSGCGAGGFAPGIGGNTEVVLVSIAITPANPDLILGTLNQFTAIGTFSDQSTKDITASVDWSSSNQSIAAINNGGLAAAFALGSLSISATSDSITGSTSVSVQSPTLISISILPSNGTIAATTTVQFHALGNYSDGSVQNVTRQVTWASSNTAVAQILGTGDSKGQAAGSSTITATLGSISGSTTLNVTNATIVSITVMPPSQTIAVGTTLDFTASGRFSDNSVQNITDDVTFSSDNTAVATIDNNTDIATGVTPGTANISATFNGVTGSTPLNVTSATISSISVTPATAELAPNSFVDCTATATLSDGTTQVITDDVTWSSSNPSVAAVDNTGSVGAVSAGSATISAQFGAVTGTSTILVNPQLTAIQISPASASIAAQTGFAFTALGTFADGTTQDLTDFVLWTSSVPSVATVSAGDANGLAPGTSTIVALLDGLVGTAQLTVTGAKANSIVVSPAAAALELGSSTKFKAIGSFSDGTIRDVTPWVRWTLSSPDVASLTSAGIARGAHAGMTTVTATMDEISGAAVLSVH